MRGVSHKSKGNIIYFPAWIAKHLPEEHFSSRRDSLRNERKKVAKSQRRAQDPLSEGEVSEGGVSTTSSVGKLAKGVNTVGFGGASSSSATRQ